MIFCNTKKENLKCPKCDYICEKGVTLNKQIDTKHESTSIDVKLCNYKCSLCEDPFKTKNEFEAHIKEHIDEIKGLDITTLTNSHDMFECNLCSFESGVGDSIKEHLIDHVNYSNLEDRRNKEEIAKNLLDEYDDDENYIGNDWALIDSDSESESNDEN